MNRRQHSAALVLRSTRALPVLLLAALLLIPSSTDLPFAGHPAPVTPLGPKASSGPIRLADEAAPLPQLHSQGSVVATIDLVANQSRPGTDQPAIEDASGGAVYDPVSRELFVRAGDSGGLSVIDGVTNRVLTDLKLPLTQNPYTLSPNMAVNSLTGELYASNSFGSNVSIINGTANRVEGAVSVGGSPYALTFDPTDKEIYVANWGGANITVISSATDRVVANIPAGTGPSAILYDPASGQVFVTNFYSGNLTIIRTSTHTVVADLKTGTYPASLALDTHDDRVDVANGNGGAQSHVTVVDATLDTIVGNITVGSGPQALAYAPIQNQMFVANDASRNVSVLNQSTDTITATIPVGTAPASEVYDTVNRNVYVLNSESSNLTVLDPATDAVAKTLGLAGGLSYVVQYDPTSGNVFTVNQGTFTSGGPGPHAEANVTVVGGSSNLAIASIPIQVLPMGLLYDPAAQRMLVNDPGGNRTYVVDPASRSISTTFPQGFFPKWSALDTYNGEIYTVNPGSYNITVVDSAFHYVGSVGTGYSPTAIVYDAANGDFYVTDNLGGNVSVINGSTHAVVTSILIKQYDNLDGILYDPHNSLVYVADLTGDNVTIIDGSTQTTAGSIPVGLYPSTFAFDSANDTIFVANSGSGNASVINDTTNKVVANFAMYGAGFIVYDAATDVVYNAMRYSGDAQAFNAASYGAIGGYINLGSPIYPSGIAYDPDTQEVYITIQDLGAISVLSSASYYPVQFVETGLPASTTWSVTVNGTLNSSSSRTIGFTEPNGSYVFTIGSVASYAANVTSGGFTVSGGAKTVDIGFSHLGGPTSYNVWFNESGLPLGTAWGVTLNGTLHSTSGGSIVFSETNGSYAFSLGSVTGFTANVTSGSVTVAGSAQVRWIGFTPSAGSGATYPVTFNETGLPLAATWSVTLGGGTLSSTTPSILFTRINGSYTFSVGAVVGYGASPSAGSLTVNGQAIVKNVTFTPGAATLTASLVASPASVQVLSSTTLTTTTSGGSPPFIYAYSHLPPGCTSADSAVLDCTPSAVGNYTAEVEVTDLVGSHAYANASLVVNPSSGGATPGQSGSWLTTYWWVILLVLVVGIVVVVLVARRRRGPPSTATPPSAPPVRGGSA